MTEDTPLLRHQLAEALGDWARGEGDAVEIAALAGLLDRSGETSTEMDRARAIRDDLLIAIDALDVDAIVDRLTDLGEDEEPEVVDAALLALDEVCAAATFLGRADAIRGAVDVAARAIDAFPEGFVRQAALASALLRSSPPLDGDPSWAVWRAVEVAAVAREPAGFAQPDFGTLRRLGLPALVATRPFEAEIRLAAAEALSPAPPWQSLVRQGGWEIALTARDGETLLCVAGPEGATPRAERQGQAVALESEPVGVWTTPALPGEWTFVLGGETVTFGVEP